MNCWLCNEPMKEIITDIKGGWAEYKLLIKNVNAYQCPKCKDRAITNHYVDLIEKISTKYYQMEDRPNELDLLEIDCTEFYRNEINKLIFLDIDGVLNIGKEKDRYIEYYNNKEPYFLNELYYWKSMFKLRDLVLKTKASIVLTSNRREIPLIVEKFKANLLLYDLKEYYYGMIPIEIKGTKCKGIEYILNKPSLNITHYVILDDFEPNFINPKIKKNLVLVNPNLGVTAEVKDKCLEILNK